MIKVGTVKCDAVSFSISNKVVMQQTRDLLEASPLNIVPLLT